MEGSSYRRSNYSECMAEIQGKSSKSILVRVREDSSYRESTVFACVSGVYYKTEESGME